MTLSHALPKQFTTGLDVGRSRKQVTEDRGARLQKMDTGDPSAIAAGLRRCSERFPAAWLDGTSPFLVDAVQAISCSDSQLTASFDDVCDYAGAATVLHATDSWNLLGRGISNLLSGHVAEAAHLVYYSELRAAMSLMAASGTLIIADQSLAVRNNGTVSHIRQAATHSLVWDLLDEWSTTRGARDFVGEILRFQRASLSRWLSEAQQSSSATATIASLLHQWGIDLKVTSRDRRVRNWASYQPSGFTPIDSVGYANWARGIAIELGQLLEPGNPGTFPALDSQLVVRILGNELVVPSSQLHRIATRVMGSSYEGERVSTLVSRERASGPDLLSDAFTTPPNADASRSSISGMFGRAVIMARLATGGAIRLQQLAALDPSVFSGWADEIGIRHGYWDPSARPEPLTDLWNDLSLAHEDLGEASLSGLSGARQMQLNAPLPLISVAGITRAALWSISA